MMTDRKSQINFIFSSDHHWDALVTPVRASGLGAALDTASRGNKTLLLEKFDFAKGPSSISPKLVHGGGRYLQNGDISLVIEALQERDIMREKAPHLVSNLSFVMPSYDWWNNPFLWDWSKNLFHDGLRSGVIYQDGSFDDSCMTMALMRTAQTRGATLLSYIEVLDFIKTHDEGFSGVIIRENINNTPLENQSKVMINATVVFSDQLIQQDHSSAKAKIQSSEGVHLVLDQEFLDSDKAIMVTQTTDRKVLFASLRPLATGNNDAKKAKEGSRHREILLCTSGLVNILGGKWATHSKIAQDAIDTAYVMDGLAERKGDTPLLPIHGFEFENNNQNPLKSYVMDAQKVRALDKKGNQSLSNKLYLSKNQIIWSIKRDMVCCLEDVLSHTTSCLFLDAKESLAITPLAA